MGEFPRHVAIIMDGNGRWAKKRLLPRAAGHRVGAKAVRKAVEFAAEQGIEVLSLFALSVENLKYRPRSEINLLMSLFLDSLRGDTAELHENNIRIRFIGERTVFDQSLQAQMESSEKLTKDNTGLILMIAINYSGRWDVVQATQKIATLVKEGDLNESDITETTFENYLSTASLPSPDLLIRTSGEGRISNFMLWQFAYTELYFTNELWPDFDAAIFQAALNAYAKRERKFGKILESMEVKHA